MPPNYCRFVLGRLQQRTNNNKLRKHFIMCCCCCWKKVRVCLCVDLWDRISSGHAWKCSHILTTEYYKILCRSHIATVTAVATNTHIFIENLFLLEYNFIKMFTIKTKVNNAQHFIRQSDRQFIDHQSRSDIF